MCYFEIDCAKHSSRTHQKCQISVKRINIGDLSGQKNEFWGPFPSKNCKIGDGIGNGMTRWVNTDDRIDIGG
jgi:hypothetical protein